MAEILMFEGQRPLHLADAYDARAEQRALREGIIQRPGVPLFVCEAGPAPSLPGAGSLAFGLTLAGVDLDSAQEHLDGKSQITLEFTP